MHLILNLLKFYGMMLFLKFYFEEQFGVSYESIFKNSISTSGCGPLHFSNA